MHYAFVPPSRHLLRARDLVDARYVEPLTVDDMAGAAGLSRAHFSREFRRAFGVSPHAYLLAHRLERAASLLLMTDRTVTDICFSVGLQSLGSFTTSFTRRFGLSPTATGSPIRRPPTARSSPPASFARTGATQHVSRSQDGRSRLAWTAFPPPPPNKENQR